MEGTYARLKMKNSEKMHFHIRIIGSQNRMLTSADFEVDLSHIPANLLKPISEKEISVCAIYTPTSTYDLTADSSAADTLLSYVHEALADQGVSAKVCPPEIRIKESVRVEVRMQSSKKRISGGYILASGKVRLKVIGSDGRVIGVLSEDDKLIIKNNQEEAAERIIAKIFSESRIGNELAGIILGR